MATKSELIRNMNLYDVDTLERLHIIAKTILQPSQNQLVNVDFSRMVEHAHTLADQHFPEWTDRSKSDFGEFLVEIMALFSDKDFWYINYAHKEAFLSRAETYKNIVHKAISNGVKPPGLQSAMALFEMVVSAGDEEIIPRGAIEFGLSGIPEVTFTNEEFTLLEAAADSTVEIPLFHGVQKEFQGDFNGRNILLTDVNIADKSIVLHIGGEKWTETNSFSEGLVTTKHFMALFNELGQVEIVFARGDYGVVPTFGTPYVATYRVGGGRLGNLLEGTLTTILKADTTREILSITQNNPTKGGLELMGKEDIRALAVSYQRTLGNIVSINDPVIIAEEMPSVRRASAIAISNLIILSVVPEDGTLDSPEFLDEVEEYMRDRVGFNYGLTVSSPDYVDFTANIEVYVLPSLNNEATAVVVREIVRDYTDAARDAQFGEGVKRVTLANLISSQINGVQNVDFQELYAGNVATPVNDINISPNQILRYDDSRITITVKGGF